jgi:hemerythrin
MDAEEKVRALCARAAATDDADEVDEILAELRALLGEHFARLEELIEQRRRFALRHVRDAMNTAA